MGTKTRCKTDACSERIIKLEVFLIKMGMDVSPDPLFCTPPYEVVFMSLRLRMAIKSRHFHLLLLILKRDNGSLRRQILNIRNLEGNRNTKAIFFKIKRIMANSLFLLAPYQFIFRMSLVYTIFVYCTYGLN